MSDDALDRVIDDVARELTIGEPDHAFRVRVLARIESGDAVRSRRAAWIIAPLAAAAVIAVAVATTWHRSPERLALQQPQTPHATSQRREPGTATREPGTQNPEPRTGNQEPRTVDREPRTVNLEPRPRTLNPEPRTPNPDASRASDVVALAPPLLSVPSITVAPIAPGESLALPPLEAPPSLDITPLESPEPRTENKNENQNEN